MVQAVIAANKELGFNGLGPVSQKSLPLYAGRFTDRVTGQIKTISTFPSSLTNPASAASLQTQLESSLVAKWNSYVKAEESLLKFFQKVEKNYDFAKNAARKVARATTLEGMKKMALGKLKGIAQKIFLRQPIFGITPGSALYIDIKRVL